VIIESSTILNDLPNPKPKLYYRFAELSYLNSIQACSILHSGIAVNQQDAACEQHREHHHKQSLSHSLFFSLTRPPMLCGGLDPVPFPTGQEFHKIVTQF